MSTKVDLTSSERTFYGTQFRGSLMLSLSWPGCLGAINGRKAPPKRSLDGAPSNTVLAKNARNGALSFRYQESSS